MFQFETDDASLDKRTVWLAVWHSDRFRNNVFLGDVIVPLHGYEFDARPMWYPLQQQGREASITLSRIIIPSIGIQFFARFHFSCVVNRN